MLNREKVEFMKNSLSEYKLQQLREKAEEITFCNYKKSWSTEYKKLLINEYNKKYKQEA